MAANSPQDRRRRATDLRPERSRHGGPPASDNLEMDAAAAYSQSLDEASLKRRLRRRRGSSVPGILVAAIAALGSGAGLAFLVIGQHGEDRSTAQTGPGRTLQTLGRDQPAQPDALTSAQPTSPPKPGRDAAVANASPTQPHEDASPDRPMPSSEPAQAIDQSQSAPQPTEPTATPSAQSRTAQAEPEPKAGSVTSSLAPATPASPAGGPNPAEVSGLVRRAYELIGRGDIGGARLLLDRAVSANDGAALFALAETYDPVVLARWRVWGVGPDAEQARSLYQKALERGITQAQERLKALR